MRPRLQRSENRSSSSSFEELAREPRQLSLEHLRPQLAHHGRQLGYRLEHCREGGEHQIQTQYRQGDHVEAYRINRCAVAVAVCVLDVPQKGGCHSVRPDEEKGCEHRIRRNRGDPIDDEDTPYRKLRRTRWAALNKRVYEVDPLRCPNCGGEMEIIAVIERRDQPDVVERILRHRGLWDRPTSRAPPAPGPTQLDLELQYVDTDEFLMAL
ncbi:MAG: hypothetical protein HN742_39655 [Lentisphaerae bacterium]|nr:hypothetical protein [Lentisphaerota bacterium]MBT7848051.1 hypothetical protein [Lentisphaerota bacterium]